MPSAAFCFYSLLLYLIPKIRWRVLASCAGDIACVGVEAFFFRRNAIGFFKYRDVLGKLKFECLFAADPWLVVIPRIRKRHGYMKRFGIRVGPAFFEHHVFAMRIAKTV